MNQPILCIVLIFISCFCTQGQSYIGAGKSQGISTSSSPVYQGLKWEESTMAIRTIDGSGMNDSLFSAARFLMQASLGFTEQHVADVIQLGFEGWIDDQFSSPVTLILPKFREILSIVNDSLTANNLDTLKRGKFRQFNYAWWHINQTNDDLLRHKVACALSEIMVISKNSDLDDYGGALASYYDVLLQHAFGNYRDLLYDVSLHAAMGYYLSHANNPKTDTTISRYPDENYAREIKQLMSIGLFELNPDGTRKQANGEDIPTYNNADITEYAKVFTGLSYGALFPGSTRTLKFGMNKSDADLTVPMIMYDTDDPTTSTDEDQHENGPKYLLNGDTIPDGQTGLQDISDAIDNLFNHPNVAPFISHLLIQRLVKSNPSPSYVERVAMVFNDNGAGIKGDMKAVIKAILLDEEARDCSYQFEDINSRLKEPIFRYTQFVRSVEKISQDGFLWNTGKGFDEDAGQEILAAPSVFNFFLPIDGSKGELKEAGLVAPEFKLHDTKFSIGYINEVHDWTHQKRLMEISEKEFNQKIYWNTEALEPLAKDIEQYINWIDDHITHGKMSDHLRSVLRFALHQIDSNRTDYLEDRVTLGMYMALISPDYNIIE